MARRSSAELVVLEGIVKVNVPAVMVCEPKVWTLTAVLLCMELYISTASKAVAIVTVLYTMLADGVQ